LLGSTLNLTSGVEYLMFTVLQRYRVRLGTVAEAAARAEETLVPRLREAAAFVAYDLLHTGDGTVTVLAVFETRPAADAAARVLSDWFRSDWPAFRLLPPDLSVAESLTLAQANGDAGLAPASGGDVGSAEPYADAVSDQGIGAELQIARDRRRIGERRLLVVVRVPERRSAVERRSDLERRAGWERREGWERRGMVAPTETVVMSERRRIAPAWRRREAYHSR
jgi:hypothetical protein